MGDTKKEFLIHSALVANQSDELDKMVNGTFVEAQQGFAVIADIDDDTLIAFAEFMYRGDYSLPSPTVPDCQLSITLQNQLIEMSSRR